MKPRDSKKERRRRVGQILALALVWAVGVLALVSERAARERPAPVRTPAGASKVAGVARDVVVGVPVDVGRAQHDACNLEAVSFRTHDEGWVTDACGRAFHTTDGGVTFDTVPMGSRSLALMEGNIFGNLWLGEVTRMEWLSDERGIAFANNVRSEETLVMVSTDGGATWRRRRLPVPDGEHYYASDHAGQTVWACGATGAIMRSRDGGASFAPTRRTPFDQDDRCMALSFIDGDSGWAGGMDGTLYATDDGGDRWMRMEPPRGAHPTGKTTTAGRPVYDLRVSGVARESRDLGWVAMEQANPEPRAWTYVTADGGRTWLQAEAPAAVAARLGRGSRWGDGGAVIARGRLLAFFVDDELVRRTPLVGGDRGELEVIRGREQREQQQAGRIAAWTDHAVIESFDDARTWSTRALVGQDPARIRRVVHPRAESDRALIELANGGILTGWDELSPSAQPDFDRFVMDMTDARRRGMPAPPGPLTCLTTAAEGRLTLRLGALSCFDSNDMTVRIAWTADAASLSVDQWSKHDPAASRILAAAERAALLRAIADAVQRPDDGSHGCTASTDAKLEWICGAAPPVGASFDESNCEASDTGPVHRLVGVIQKVLSGADPR